MKIILTATNKGGHGLIQSALKTSSVFFTYNESLEMYHCLRWGLLFTTDRAGFIWKALPGMSMYKYYLVTIYGRVLYISNVSDIWTFPTSTL